MYKSGLKKKKRVLGVCVGRGGGGGGIFPGGALSPKVTGNKLMVSGLGFLDSHAMVMVYSVASTLYR